jgi:hypothetical protein
LLVEETRVPRENLLQVTGLYNSYQLPLSKENIFTRQQKYVTCRSINNINLETKFFLLSFIISLLTFANQNININ